MINAFEQPTLYREMLERLSDNEFNELSNTIKYNYSIAIDDDNVTDKEFNELFYAQSLIGDEYTRRLGSNDHIGFTFNKVGL